MSTSEIRDRSLCTPPNASVDEDVEIRVTEQLRMFSSEAHKSRYRRWRMIELTSLCRARKCCVSARVIYRPARAVELTP